MEHIRNAVERAKGSRAADPRSRPAARQPNANDVAQKWGTEVMLNGEHLESNRIISQDITDSRSKSFDILRTEVLQSMDSKPWQLLGVTSPTASCGKSVVSMNLALSIARQPDRSVLLVDMDLQKPQVANYLGLTCDHGLMSVLEGRSSLSNALIHARIRTHQLLVLPCEAPTMNSSEWMVSREMSALLDEIKRDFRSWTVIFDLPPILPSDDVISILPQIDCVLFVAGAGTTTVAEFKACNKYLESASVVRVVVNKALDADPKYYSYGRYANQPASQTKADRTRDQSPRRKKRSTRTERVLDRLSRF